jgi:hypothetical protein
MVAALLSALAPATRHLFGRYPCKLPETTKRVVTKTAQPAHSPVYRW